MDGVDRGIMFSGCPCATFLWMPYLKNALGQLPQNLVQMLAEELQMDALTIFIVVLYQALACSVASVASQGLCVWYVWLY